MDKLDDGTILPSSIMGIEIFDYEGNDPILYSRFDTLETYEFVFSESDYNIGSESSVLKPGQTEADLPKVYHIKEIRLKNPDW